MRVLIIFTVLLLAGVWAERYIPNSADPANPTGCWHKELQLKIKYGEFIKPKNVGDCFELGCVDNNVIRVNECGRYPAHCSYVGADLTQEYPKCCPTVSCVALNTV